MFIVAAKPCKGRKREVTALHSPGKKAREGIRSASRNVPFVSRHQLILELMSKETLVILSGSCAVLGFLSIIASIYIWLRVQFPLQEAEPDAVISIAVAARAERSAIFVGLWAPSFFALAGFLRAVANG